MSVSTFLREWHECTPETIRRILCNLSFISFSQTCVLSSWCLQTLMVLTIRPEGVCISQRLCQNCSQSPSYQHVKSEKPHQSRTYHSQANISCELLPHEITPMTPSFFFFFFLSSYNSKVVFQAMLSIILNKNMREQNKHFYLLER